MANRLFFRIALAGCAVLGCRPKATVEAVDAGLSVVASASEVASAQALAPPASSPAPEIVPADVAALDRWNDAHNKRDQPAFEALYAPSVKFYGQTLTGAECVKRKMTALAKSADYTQRVHYVVRESDPRGSWLQFKKTTHEKGKDHDYSAYLRLGPDMRIVEEGDRDTDAALNKMGPNDWCFDEPLVPNDNVRPPFKFSSMTAIRSFHASKFFKKLEAAHPGRFLSVGQFSCPMVCPPSDPRKCDYELRVEDHSPDRQSVSNLVTWVHVDARTNVLWWEVYGDDGGSTWQSEPLTQPLP